MPVGLGNCATGVTSKLTAEWSAGARKAPGRKLTDACPSAVKTEPGSTTPLLPTFTDPCPLCGGWFELLNSAGGDTHRYGEGAAKPSKKPGATIQAATPQAAAARASRAIRRPRPGPRPP